MPLTIRIQWNAGTACVSECVLKTLAYWGLRVGPSKFSRLHASATRRVQSPERSIHASHGKVPVTVRVKTIIGSLLTLENLFPQNYRYRYRLEFRMNSFNYHYRYRLDIRSHTFVSIDSQSPSWKSFELISPKITVTVTVLKCFWIIER